MMIMWMTGLWMDSEVDVCGVLVDSEIDDDCSL